MVPRILRTPWMLLPTSMASCPFLWKSKFLCFYTRLQTTPQTSSSWRTTRSLVIAGITISSIFGELQKWNHEGRGRQRIVVGRFIPMEAAMRANIVPWHVAMDKEVQTGLVAFLGEASRRKRKATDSQSLSKRHQSNWWELSPLTAAGQYPTMTAAGQYPSTSNEFKEWSSNRDSLHVGRESREDNCTFWQCFSCWEATWASWAVDLNWHK